MQRFYAYAMITALVSFLGFWVENVWCLLTKGYMNNRSMVFPFLLGYGIAIMLIFLLFGTPQKAGLLNQRIQTESRLLNNCLYFITVMVCVCVGEIVLGKFVERVCGFCWWDYSNLPLHITQYTSVPTGIAFASLIFIFMRFLFEPLYNYFLSWNPRTLAVVASILLAVMIGDFVYSSALMYTRRSLTERWRLDLSSSALYRGVQSLKKA